LLRHSQNPDEYQKSRCSGNHKRNPFKIETPIARLAHPAQDAPNDDRFNDGFLQRKT